MSSESPDLLPETTTPRRKRSRPLRFHLMLWYGAFVVLSLSIFALLFLWLAASSLYQSVDNTIDAEARVAVYDLQGAIKDRQLQIPFPSDNLKLITKDVFPNSVI